VLADTQKDVETFKANKKLDEGACPKVTYGASARRTRHPGRCDWADHLM